MQELDHSKVLGGDLHGAWDRLDEAIPWQLGSATGEHRKVRPTRRPEESEMEVMDNIRSGPYSQIFCPDNFVFS